MKRSGAVPGRTRSASTEVRSPKSPYYFLEQHAATTAQSNDNPFLLFFALNVRRRSILSNFLVMQATSFGALIMLGNQRMWLEKFQEYLNLDHAAEVVSNPSFNRLKLKIYHREGIDYIFPEVTFYSIDQIYDAADNIKWFIAERHYLEANMLFVLHYMSPKFHQVLRCLAVANIDIGLVSLVPGELSSDLYVEACSSLNIKHTVFADRTMDLIDAEKHLQGFVEHMFSPEVSALACLSLNQEAT